MKFTINDLFRALKIASIYWPYTGELRDQIQSYAVINNFDQLNDEFMSQYAEKKSTDLFFSRKWAELQYNASEIVMTAPYLVVFEDDDSILVENPMNPPRSKVKYELELYVLDHFQEIDPEATSKDQVVDFRTVQEIYIATEKIMRDLFYFLSRSIVFAKVDGASVNSIATIGLLQHQKDQNVISSYTIDYQETNRWQEMLMESNPEISMSRVSISALELHGVVSSLSIIAMCPSPPVFDYAINVPTSVTYDHPESAYPEAQDLLLNLDGSVMGDQDAPIDLSPQ